MRRRPVSVTEFAGYKRRADELLSEVEQDAVIDLVAAVGLWLAAAWGAVIWLTAVASMLALEIFFPQVFGASLLFVALEGALLALYLWLALKSAQEHPL